MKPPGIGSPMQGRDLIDFREATNEEVMVWFQRQATNFDNTVSGVYAIEPRLFALYEWTAIVSSLVGELFKRLPPDGKRPQ